MRGEASVAVVIPSWNTLEFLPRCLDSVRERQGEIELLVVDNGSSDGSIEYLREAGVAHVPLPENVGFAAAVNLGVSQTSAESILVLNADTLLEPGCVERLHEALAGDASLGGVQPRILQLEGEHAAPPAADEARLYSVGQALTRDGRAFEKGAGERQRGEHRRGQEVFGVCGAACLLRRELFVRLGGYDERYFAFYEDVDLNVRARIAGWRFAYVPEGVVWHVGNAAWSSGFQRPAADNAKLVARNRLATQIKFMPWTSVPRIVAVEAGSLFRAGRERRLGATLAGKLAALGCWAPRLIEERRRLRRSGDPRRAVRWLGAEAGNP
ncbi:MAG TPA: glycosyltransferase family 2 protein [Solirubrobacterales bacterium]|nr:glycosyltransferase family 2 protein [Solirubrobacterales bacterium]